ncbi:MAG: hypothetical protein PWP31_1500 [Clostridia bacterium]|nr:hypothetical protein [Clostridia bacterium]
MKLTVLGRYAPLPGPGGACSGYLITSGKTNILIDGGNGVVSRLLQKISIDKLNAIVLSHLHPDHYADLHCIRHAVKLMLSDGRMKSPLTIYAPDEPKENLKWMEAKDLVEVKKLNPLGMKIGDFTFSFARTKHPIPCYAMRVTDERSVFFYSADTAASEGVFSLAKGADLALAEASLLEKDAHLKNIGHLTAYEAANFLKKANVKRGLLTHFLYEYNLDDLLAEAKKGWEQVELAEEGMTYKF